MKRSIAIYSVLLGWLIPGLRLWAAEEQPASTSSFKPDPEGYPWSETAETVRLPKSLLEQLSIQSLTMTNFETRQYLLTEPFVVTFKLSPEEVDRVTSALAAAVHEYRLAEARHLEPVEPDRLVSPPQRRGKAIMEVFTYRLNPFPEEALAIRRKLEADVLSILGEQRAKYFWQMRLVLDSELKTFQDRSIGPPGDKQITTYTYQLTDALPGPYVDLYKKTVNISPDGRERGGGSMGVTYFAPLDLYAPDSLKPALRRWRKAIASGDVRNLSKIDHPSVAQENAEASATVSPVVEDQSPAGVSVKPEVAKAAQPSKWDDNAAFVDLPKSIINGLQIAGLDAEGELSGKAITVFGLTPEDTTAVRQLYHEMKARFEKLERANFVRDAPEKNSFVLRAFPEENAALQREWLSRLKKLVGEERGDLLDRSIRTPLSHMELLKRRMEHKGDPRDFMKVPFPNWLHRGTEGLQVRFWSDPAGADGVPRFRIEYQSLAEGGGGGTWGGRQDAIPERWRHLLTPDVLGIPMTL